MEIGCFKALDNLYKLNSAIFWGKKDCFMARIASRCNKIQIKKRKYTGHWKKVCRFLKLNKKQAVIEVTGNDYKNNSHKWILSHEVK